MPWTIQAPPRHRNRAPPAPAAALRSGSSMFADRRARPSCRAVLVRPAEIKLDHLRGDPFGIEFVAAAGDRSEEHTSELQSLMRSSYAVFCLKTKNNRKIHNKKYQIYIH